MIKERSPQKTIPSSGRRHFTVRRQPDRPQVSTLLEFKLDIKVPTSHHLNGDSEIAKKVHLDEGHGRKKTVFVIPASITEPLTPSFVIRTGGHRTGGGGTSREALRRARKNQQRTHHK